MLLMVERILLLLKVKNLSPSKFADEIGIQRSGMSHIMSGRNQPSLDLVMKILNTFKDVNADWLLHGTGPMLEGQIDLFSPPKAVETVEIAEKDEAAITETTVVKEEQKPVITPEEPVKDENADKASVQAKKVPVNESDIDKIVIFYKNRTFSEYYPSS